MLVKVVLCDINAKMIKAWRDTFEENPEVEIVEGSMLDCQVSAWVTPTNSGGRMDGGLDLVIKNHLGAAVEKDVQAKIKSLYGGKMDVGYSTCVATGRAMPKYLISTPTMVSSNEDVSDTLNVALACAAAFQAVHTQNETDPASIRSVALPGLGANTGRVPAEICADLMWTAYNLFREKSFANYGEMRAALEAELGDLGPSSKPPKAAASAATNGSGHATDDEEAEESDPGDKDFDDHE